MLIKIGKSRPRSRPANGIIVKNYEHYNRAFGGWDCPSGKYISSKAEYEKELNKQGLITTEAAEKQGLNSGAKRHEYEITKETQQLIENVRQTADSKGNIKPGDKAIDALTSKKPKYNPQALPSSLPTEGGVE
jgi:TM2 domain-containing membrane protein YozV